MNAITWTELHKLTVVLYICVEMCLSLRHSLNIGVRQLVFPWLLFWCPAEGVFLSALAVTPKLSQSLNIAKTGFICIVIYRRPSVFCGRHLHIFSMEATVWLLFLISHSVIYMLLSWKQMATDCVGVKCLFQNLPEYSYMTSLLKCYIA